MNGSVCHLRPPCLVCLDHLQPRCRDCRAARLWAESQWWVQVDRPHVQKHNPSKVTSKSFPLSLAEMSAAAFRTWRTTQLSPDYSRLHSVGCRSSSAFIHSPDGTIYPFITRHRCNDRSLTSSWVTQHRGLSKLVFTSINRIIRVIKYECNKLLCITS